MEIKNPEAWEYVCTRNEDINLHRMKLARRSAADRRVIEAQAALAAAEQQVFDAARYTEAVERVERVWTDLTRGQRKHVIAALRNLDPANGNRPPGERLSDVQYQHVRRGSKLIALGVTDSGKRVLPEAPEALRTWIASQKRSCRKA